MTGTTADYKFLDESWAKALIQLKRLYTDVIFDTWIKTLEPIYYDEDIYIVQTNRDLFKSTIEQRYLKDITGAVRNATGTDFVVKITSSQHGGKNSSQEFDDLHDRLNRSNLKARYVFESFVKGKSTDFAYAASVAVAESPGQSAYNPLFIYGGVGLGKTHLMQSIGNFIIEANKDAKVLYVSSEDFTNELIKAIKDRKNLEFRNKYRGVDVLMIDDIQFISEKESTQEEFFHTFNTLHNAGKQIVITSDQPPKKLETLEERLRSRFGWGLIADITLPDFETRTAILEKKADAENLRLPKDITQYLSKNIVSNVRDLEGALNKISAMSKLSEQSITIESAELIVQEIMGESAKREITMELVQQIVADYYSLTLADIKSRRRTKNVAYPRQIAMYLCRKLLDESSTKIGQAFGKDHSTIIHGCDKIADDVEHDIHLRNVLFEIENRIKG
ncbi:MAG: chromosomal replication initiator protein DnaA [Defluviitaleaceae bacterium]|nr:chromosomal replication initiator protein DnaA [Defluviitaleaceae bacterium]